MGLVVCGTGWKVLRNCKNLTSDSIHLNPDGDDDHHPFNHCVFVKSLFLTFIDQTKTSKRGPGFDTRIHSLF